MILSPIQIATCLILSFIFATESALAFFPASNPRIQSTNELIPLDDYVLTSKELPFDNAFLSYKITSKSMSGDDSKFVGGSVSSTSKRSELIPVSEYVPQHFGKRDTSSVSSYCSNSQAILNENNDTVYVIEVEVGSNNDTFKLVIDTGSYYIWVYGEDCTDPACISHNNFGKSKSSTFETTSSTFSITYSSDVVKGNIIIDDFRIAGFENRMKIGSVTQAGKTFENFAIDGILGLSAVDKSASFPGLMEILKKENQINKRIFAINLPRDEDEKSKQDEGVLTIGSVDESKYTGDITYTAINDGSSLWQIPLDGLYVNGTLVKLNETRQAIVDTGTTLLIMPSQDALQIHGYIDGAVTDGVNFAVPCDTTTKLELEFSGQKWSISPKDYIGGNYDSNGRCISNIQGLDIVDSKWILGAVFLKNVYSVFDMDNLAVGFAEKSYKFQNIASECAYVDKSNSVSSYFSSSLSSHSSASSSLSPIPNDNLNLNPLVDSSSGMSSMINSITSTFSSTVMSGSSASTATASGSSAKASGAESSSPSSSSASLIKTILIALFSVSLVMVCYA
ncbi:acid protease [Nadsonia fulvescens var. elongata DSM 6958]|uniref:Acid protease n=1 Tax=Nadsonia fulvescens var. elongata DSM 6958 TaxID=857566 RepID=A0A1E3PDR7_9ASCO|nr:acid protease [Nadsonia fulvescens var. elongata DSM 6958]